MSIAKTVNGGDSWSYFEINEFQGCVYSMSVDPRNTNVLYVGGYCDQGSGYYGEVYKSTNGGKQWTNISGDIRTSRNYVNALVIDPESSDRILAGCEDGLFESTDAGLNWNKSSTNFYSISDIVFDTVNDQIFLSQYYGGVYVSKDNAQSWQELNDNLTNMNIQCLGIDDQNQYLFAGSDGGGVYRMSILTAIEDEINLPDVFSLKQNYPNPFNPETVISYQIGVNQGLSEHVDLSIYSLLGQKVATLVSEKQPSGIYQVTWDASEFSSGVYLYKLQCGNYVETKKMVLMR